MSSVRIYGFAGAISCLTLLALGGCAREASDQMSWARAALERNAAVEIVATDPQTRTFTVRDKASGQLRMVRADELIGGATGGKPAADAAQATQQAAAMTPAATAPTEAPPASSAWRSDQSATPGSTAAPSQAQGASATPVAPARGEIASDGSRVLEAGPGYSIKTAAPLSTGARSASGPGSIAPVERRHDPIVCQGARLVQIDNRNLVFDGDAVSAEDGCEIHITNSRIVAKGVGVLARSAAVHIQNSDVEGDSASVDASGGAQVYSSSSTFKGIRRRGDNAAFHDLGGNAWN